MKEAINIESATAEVTAWLDKNKVMPGRRERMSASIDNLIEAVQYGIISIKDDGAIAHKLQFAILDDKEVPVISELNYKARVSVDNVLSALSKLKTNTADAQLYAYIAELTGQAYSIITKLLNADMIVAKSIGVFFMS